MTVSGRPALDAIVVGAGPNGLAAALTLARAGRSVRVYEAAPTIGGGTRTEELTLPGFRHDVCSTIVPLALASPFFRTIDWAAHGVELVHPDAPVAHALDDGRAVVLERSFTATAAGLDRDRRTDDGSAWRVCSARWPATPTSSGASCCGRSSTSRATHSHWPASGLPALRSAGGLARARFRGEPARALFAGARRPRRWSPLDRPLSASFGLVLGTYAHAVGWPMVRGGSAAIADALAAELRRLGGEIVTGQSIAGLDDLPEARAVLLDTTPRAAVVDRRRPAAVSVRAAATRASATEQASSRSTGRSTARSRGPPTACVARRRSTSAGRSRRSLARSGRSQPAGRPTARSRCSSSTTRGTRRARRPARRPHGRTATSPPDPTST